MHHQSAFLDRPPEFRGAYRTDHLACALYAEGAGIQRVMPTAVAVPADADDLVPLVRWARRLGLPLTPRGSGSSMAGGAIGPGIVVDLSRFDRAGEVDVQARRIRVGTGVLRGQVDAAARVHGLRFPVDPSSGAFCTIGGMIGTNAAGARFMRFGATRAWVRGLHCVFDDGSAAWIFRDEPLPLHVPAVARLDTALRLIRQSVNSDALQHAGVRKESSGYGIAAAFAPAGHLLDVLVGSEGTLAFFTEAELSLAPVAGGTATALVSFATLEAASNFAGAARSHGATACEMLDRTFLDVAASREPTGVRSGVDAVLLIEVEGESPAEARSQLDWMAEASRKQGAVDVALASTPETERELWTLRHAASPILAQLAPRLQSMQFIEDGCVPPPRFAEYVRGVRAALERHGTRGVIFGHAGDAHAHVNPLIDMSDARWRDRVRGILDSVSELTSNLGGTLAGEHGDGRLRAPLMARTWNAEARAAFLNVKSAGDPSGIFNPGCKVEVGSPTAGTVANAAVVIGASEGDALGVIRYDPDAVPLPPSARVALDRIERTRAWQSFRLAEAGH